MLTTGFYLLDKKPIDEPFAKCKIKKIREPWGIILNYTKPQSTLHNSSAQTIRVGNCKILLGIITLLYSPLLSSPPSSYRLQRSILFRSFSSLSSHWPQLESIYVAYDVASEVACRLKSVKKCSTRPAHVVWGLVYGAIFLGVSFGRNPRVIRLAETADKYTWHPMWLGWEHEVRRKLSKTSHCVRDSCTDFICDQFWWRTWPNCWKKKEKEKEKRKHQHYTTLNSVGHTNISRARVESLWWESVWSR